MTDRSVVRSAAWCLAYAVAVVVGRQFVTPDNGLSLFWPAAGVAVMWMLPASAHARRALDLLLLFLVTVAATSMTGSPPLAALAFGVANTVQAGVAVAVLRLVRGRLPSRLAEFEPRSLRDIGAVCATSVVAATVGSPLGALGALANGGVVTPEVLGAWIARNGSGITVLVLCTAAIAAQVQRWRASAPGSGPLRSLATGQERPVVEFLAAAATATALFTAVFGSPDHLPIAFLTLAPSAWFGIRFAPSVAGAHGLVQSVVVLVATTAGRGPFGGISDVTARAVTVQLFLVTGLLMAMTLSVSVAERRALLDRARASEARAQARADLLDTVTRDLREGLVVVDASGAVVMANAAAHDLLGADAVAVLGSPVDLPALRRPDGRPLATRERPTLRALAGEVVADQEVRWVEDDEGGAEGSTLSISAAPVGPRAFGRPDLVLTVVRDVTEARARLQELQAFSGVVAHDLKNPVAAVMSWAEILDDQLADLGPGSATARATLTRVVGTSERMQGLVEDLLAYAQAGAADVSARAVSLADLYEQALRQLPPSVVAAADVALVEPDGPVHVEVDATLVRQLLVNLVGNSLKYVDDRTRPVVRVEARPRGDRVEIDVRDNGIGIPVAEQAIVFDGFVRSSRTRSTFPGTGLGLAICARAVHRHGGTIRASDAGPGGGTLVGFTLPAAAGVPGVARTATTAPSGAAADDGAPLAVDGPAVTAALTPVADGPAPVEGTPVG